MMETSMRESPSRPGARRPSSLCLLSVSSALSSLPNNKLFQQPTLSDMTEFELTFSYRIEEILSRITKPEYRQLTIEVGFRSSTANRTLFGKS